MESTRQERGRAVGACSASPSQRKQSQGKICCMYKQKTQRRRSTQLLSHFLGKAVKVQLTESEKQDNKELAGARVRRAACSSPGRAHLVAAEVVCFSPITAAGLPALHYTVLYSSF